METWFERTQRQREATQAAQRLIEERRVQNFHNRFRPMEEKIRELLYKMPLTERGTPRKITWFRDAMRAKFPRAGSSNRAAIPEIGPALRKLGWTPKSTLATPETPYQTLWWPPADFIEQAERAKQKRGSCNENL